MERGQRCTHYTRGIQNLSILNATIASKPTEGERYIVLLLLSSHKMAIFIPLFPLLSCSRKSFKNVVATLRNHLKNKHPFLLKSTEEGPKKAPLSKEGTGSVAELVTCNIRQEPLSKAGAEKKLIKFMITSVQPFTLVEEEEFREYVRFLSQGSKLAELPSARTVRRRIAEQFKECKGNLTLEMANNDSKISCVIDCWTSANQIPFQGVVAMWISEEWELETRLIDLTHLPGSHTGANIAESFSSVLDEYGIWKKLLAVTTDNASNMDTMFKKLDEYAEVKDSLFNSKDLRIRCLAHILNLSCKDIINAVSDRSAKEQAEEQDDLSDGSEQDEDTCSGNNKRSDCFLVRLRRSIEKIRGSPQRRNIFRKQCEEMNIKPKELVLDVSTRWNTTLAMLCRVLELKEPWRRTIQKIPKLRRYLITMDDWLKVEALIRVLEPFKQATEMLSITHSPTISHTSAVYQMLFDHLETTMDNTGDKRSLDLSENWLRDAVAKGFEKLKKYYPSSDGMAYFVSTG
jgi:hypothetical protein